MARRKMNEGPVDLMKALEDSLRAARWRMNHDDQCESFQPAPGVDGPCRCSERSEEEDD